MAPDPVEPESARERTAIPEAFYRDAAPPPGAAKDPRWAEFKRSSDELPDWMILGAPLALALILALHGVVALILVFVTHQPI